MTGPADPAPPAPDSAIICGEFGALLTTDKYALLGPIASGVKITCTGHVLDGARFPGQLVVSVKSLASTPTIENPYSAVADVPTLLMTTLTGDEGTPTTVCGNDCAEGSIVSAEVAEDEAS